MSQGSPQTNVEGGPGEGERGAGDKAADGSEQPQELGEEPQSVAPSTEGGESSSSAPPPKRSRRRTALSVHQVDLNELSAQLGIPLEDDASDTEFEPSVEDLGMCVCVCVCVYVLHGVSILHIVIFYLCGGVLCMVFLSVHIYY